MDTSVKTINKKGKDIKVCSNCECGDIYYITSMSGGKVCKSGIMKHYCPKCGNKLIK